MKTILSSRMLQRLALSLLLLWPLSLSAQSNLYGDVNGDVTVNITDVNAVISIILDGKDTTSAADVNGDGSVNITDLNDIIGVILSGSYQQIYSTMLVTTTDGTTTEYLIDKNTRMRIEKPNLVIEAVGETLTWNLERLARLSFGTKRIPFNHVAMTHNEVLPQTNQEASPDEDSTSRYAMLYYGKDGLMNAFLNIDVDSITYTNADLSGRLHPNVVVQQVWTPDTLYSIPLNDLDSIGFQAPETKFKDDVFHIQEPHLPYLLGVDELSIFFSNTIPGTMLPQIGQVVISDIYEGLLVNGFAGRVEQINNDNGRIEIKCSQVAITDIFSKLFLIGKGVSDQTGSDNAPRRSSSDPWVSYEDQGIHSIDLPDELKLEIFDGIFGVTSKKPTLTVSYFIYIDEMIYSFAADAYMNHSDLSFTLAFKLSDFLAVANTGSEFLTNLILGKGDQEEAEEKFYEHDFDDIKLSIPFHWGPVNFALEIAPIFKLEGDVELDLITKTKATQHVGFNKQGLTPALLANPVMSMAIGDYRYGYTQDPLAFHQLKAKMDGSASMGILLQLKANVITEKLLHAAVGAEYDRKASTTLEFNLYDEENQPSNFYDVIKDSKVAVKDLLKIKGEIGVSPLEILTLKGAYPITIKEWGSYNIVPHFTEPELPAYADGSWTYPSLLTGCDPLSLYSTVSKDVLFKCHPGLRIEGADGVTVKQYTSSEPYQYEDAWKYIPLDLDISDLSPGNTYRCYPTLSMLGLNPFKAAPYHEFVVPEPMTLETLSVTINPGGTRDVKIIGGWGEYTVFNLDPDKFTAELKKEGDTCFVHVIGKSLGASTVTVRDLRTNVMKVFLVEVTDNVLPEQISVDPSQIDFGVVEYGTDTTKPLTVTNTGNATVSITVNSDPSFTDYFEVSSNNETKTLAPGASMNYTVTAHGAKTGCLAVTNLLVSSGGGEPQLVALSARGVDSEPLLDASSVSLNPGEQAVVWARSGNCTMTNSNESAVHVWQSGGGSGSGREEPPYESCVTSSTSRFTVEALSNGTATVVIKDEYSGQKGILTITVGEGGTDNHEWVDLGLPSGTLWATCNVGADNPEEYGDYFAWGETEPKETYDWSTYKWCNGSYRTLTKYCTESSYGYNGFVDNKTELDPEDDAATVNWGPSWRMPTKEQRDELREMCTWTWTTQNGVNGRLVTGPNGNSLFLPAAGARFDSALYFAGSDGNYWSRTLNSGGPYCAYLLDFNSDGVYWNNNARSSGFAVRAVRVSQN